MKLFKGKKKFKNKDHKDMDDFDQMPADWYRMKVVKSEVKNNSNEDGVITALRFELTKGEFKGRLLFVNLNLDNPSDEAVKRANKELATMTRAMGLGEVTDSDQLHDIEVEGKVVPVAAKNGYPAGNGIANYRKVVGSKKPGKAGKAGKSGKKGKGKDKKKSKGPSSSFGKKNKKK